MAGLLGMAAAPPTVLLTVGEDQIVVTGMAITPIRVGQPLSASAGAVCLTEAIPGARVISVELVGAENLRVSDFVVTPGMTGEPGHVGTLDSMLAGRDRRLLAVCDPSDLLSHTAVNTVNVQMERTAETADSVLRGYRIHWVADSYEGFYAVARNLRLCSDAAGLGNCPAG